MNIETVRLLADPYTNAVVVVVPAESDPPQDLYSRSPTPLASETVLPVPAQVVSAMGAHVVPAASIRYRYSSVASALWIEKKHIYSLSIAGTEPPSGTIALTSIKNQWGENMNAAFPQTR